MTISQALGNALGIVIAAGAFMGLMFWSVYAWVEGEWWERAVSTVGWVLLVAAAIYFIELQGVPA